MGYPGGDDSRMPEGWPGARPGYWPAVTPQRHDPVRGFPPAPGSPDPEYPSGTSSAPNGTGGDRPGATGGRQPGPAGRGTEVLTVGQAMPGVAAADRPGLRHQPAAWSTRWGAGPWAPRPGGGRWATGIAGTAGVAGFTGIAGRSRTWTDGDDDPTEIWTLRGYGDAQPGSPSAGRGTATPGGTAQPASPGQAFREHAGQDEALGPVPPTRRQPGRRGRSRRRGGGFAFAVVAGTVVAVMAVAGTAVYGLARHGHAAAPAPTAAGTVPLSPSPSPSAKLGKWQHIASSADDPIPLTLAELFPAHVTAGSRSFGRTAERENQSCRQAVFGAKLKAAVRNGCSQALRASYLSGNGKRMGTIGVLNLPTATAAARAGKVVTAPRQFIQPLPAKHGATRRLGQGTGVVWAVAKGHYLVLMWAQYASLFRPDAPHDRKILMQFDNDLYEKTVNQSLTRRMVTGSPLTP